MRTLAIASILLVPTLATADSRNVTLGAAVGLSQDKQDSQLGNESSQTLGVWGRLAFSPRVAGQLELARHETKYGCHTCTFGTTSDVRTATALLVVDLANGGAWMPILLAGAGLDRDTGSFQTEGHHYEGGLGLEYRSTGGFTLGADVRVGGRSIDSQQDMLLGVGGVGDNAAFVGPSTMKAGEYHSARITLGVRF